MDTALQEPPDLTDGQRVEQLKQQALARAGETGRVVVVNDDQIMRFLLSRFDRVLFEKKGAQGYEPVGSYEVVGRVGELQSEIIVAVAH